MTSLFLSGPWSNAADEIDCIFGNLLVYWALQTPKRITE